MCIVMFYSRVVLRALLASASMAVSALPNMSPAQAALSWRSSEWAAPRFAFLYERGEIHLESGSLYRLEETFERDVAPMGPVSPQAANFWRSCVISHFAAKIGAHGWSLADGPREKQEPRAAILYFLTGRTAEDLPEKYRASFLPTSRFQSLCSQFLKAEYHWWK